MPSDSGTPMSNEALHEQLTIVRGAVADREADLATEREELVMRREQVVSLSSEVEKLRSKVALAPLTTAGFLSRLRRGSDQNERSQS